MLSDTAWLLATNPNASVRNGAEAVTLPSGPSRFPAAGSRRSSTRWPPLTPRRDGFPKPWKPPAAPWNSLPKITSRLWQSPSRPRFRFTKPKLLFVRFRQPVPLTQPAARPASEVVKKWGQAPRRMPFSRSLRESARSQSPFFHNVSALLVSATPPWGGRRADFVIVYRPRNWSW